MPHFTRARAGKIRAATLRSEPSLRRDYDVSMNILELIMPARRGEKRRDRDVDERLEPRARTASRSILFRGDEAASIQESAASVSGGILKSDNQ